MNDKCSAGTGRFFEAMANAFELSLPEFSNLSLTAKNVIPITAQCTVFAESEVITLVGEGKPTDEIAAGIEMAYDDLLKQYDGSLKLRYTLDAAGHTLTLNPPEVLRDNYKSEGGVALTLDADFQRIAQRAMKGVEKGAAVVMDVATGDIKASVSVPAYDANDLAASLQDPDSPFVNRAFSQYNVGSTFKLVQGLIGLQEGVLRPSDLHSCHMGYQAGRLKMACHAHASPLDLRFAVATSCNAYFCYVFRDILDNPKYGSVKEGYDVWKQYVESFGFGRKLGSDFLDEGNGYVPDRAYYDRQYRGSWNSLTVLSLSIGQDALGCTPLQLANLACIVANRGYYYIPHIVKKIEGQDSLDARFYERHYTMVEPKHFEPIVEGMWRGVNVGGTSTRARLDGWDVCGKTGTAENPRGRDHSTFLSFAPKDNPKIAISVYVENGGFGASAALPIASLLEEYYLTDTIRRPELLQYIKDMNIYYPAYDK